jgi:hypothetical protein
VHAHRADEGDPDRVALFVSGARFAPARRKTMNMNTTTDSDLQNAAASRIVFTDELSFDSIAFMEFASRFLARGLAHTASRHWSTTTTTLEGLLPHAVLTARWRGHETGLLELDPLFGSECLAFLWLGRGDVFTRVAARDLPVVAEAEGWLREQFPERTPADHSVPVSFWSPVVAATRCPGASRSRRGPTSAATIRRRFELGWTSS